MQSFSDWEAEFKNWQRNSQAKIIGKQLILLAEIPSTNTYIKSLGQLKHGTIVAAYQQSQGKGQKNRTWISNPGGLYMSIKLNIHNFKNISPFWITAAVSIGLCKAINQIGLETTIKWPNDILIANKKVAGVLTETVMSQESITAIIGVGCNVNNSLEEIFKTFPDLKTTITSLNRELSNKYKIALWDLLEPTVNQIEYFLVKATQFDINAIKKEWIYLSKIINRKISLEKLDTHEVITGTVENITDSGTLLVKRDSGLTEEYSSGEIKTQA